MDDHQRASDAPERLTLGGAARLVDRDQDAVHSTIMFIARFARNPGRMRPGLHDLLREFNVGVKSENAWSR